MPRGTRIQVRDSLIIWDAVARGIRSATQIKRIFDETGEREISTDSISRVMGEYDELIRLLPEYPNLMKRLQINQPHYEEIKAHHRDLTETALILSRNLERFSPVKVTPDYISDVNYNFGEQEDIDDYLGKCLLSHLKAEFPELFNIEIWQEIYRHNSPKEVYQILQLVAHRRTFIGSCDVCKGWQD